MCLSVKCTSINLCVSVCVCVCVYVCVCVCVYEMQWRIQVALPLHCRPNFLYFYEVFLNFTYIGSPLSPSCEKFRICPCNACFWGDERVCTFLEKDTNFPTQSFCYPSDQSKGLLIKFQCLIFHLSKSDKKTEITILIPMVQFKNKIAISTLFAFLQSPQPIAILVSFSWIHSSSNPLDFFLVRLHLVVTAIHLSLSAEGLSDFDR